MSFAVAIDGTVGAGKSSISRKVAQEMGYVHIDTGAMYRSVALYCLETFIDLNDEKKISKALSDIDIEIKFVDGEQKIFLNELDVTIEIRAEHISVGSSKVAVVKDVRKKLVEMQRKLAEHQDVIMDGRDIGTCVLPNADIKIYLTASVEERANRRMKELIKKGENVDIEELKKEIIERDVRDSNREESPLKQAEDAIYVDTSNMSEEKAIKYIIKLINECKKV